MMAKFYFYEITTYINPTSSLQIRVLVMFRLIFFLYLSEDAHITWPYFNLCFFFLVFHTEK